MIPKTLLLLIIFTIFFTIESFSFPRFALRTGENCIDCHVNPTGGEMRNDKGWKMSKEKLAMISPSEEFKMSNKIGENIRFGFDIRGQLLGTLGDLERIDFQNMSGQIYTSVDLSEQLKMFAGYDYVNGLWEGYGMAQILPNDGYIKGGTFVPNFGIKLDDHTAYTRGGDMGFITTGKLGLIYDPYYSETGIELGIYIGDYAFFTASVGRPLRQQLLSNDPSYTARLQFNPSIGDNVNLLFGGSYTRFRSVQTTNIANMYGPFAGIGIGEFTLLGEYDMAKSYLVSDSITTALMIEASYKIVKGVEAVVQYTRFDPSKHTYNDDHSRVVIGGTFYPYSFMEIIPQYRIQMQHPNAKNNAFLIQFHLFY
jgi:hypothetical protein